MNLIDRQVASEILMIRPVDFHFNAETAINNYYQKEGGDFSKHSSNELAQSEFDQFVVKLRHVGISVVVEHDILGHNTPDSIFPNNWVSFHADGRVAIYPMYAENRRGERRNDLIEKLSKNFEITKVEDFTDSEKEGRFLEGTGSMVLDRVNKIAYAALSIRTDEDALSTFCSRFGYTSVTIHAMQDVEGQRLPIYHTNVMMCIGEHFSVVCAEAIDDVDERNRMITSLENSGKEVIFITEKQKHHFAGNMLQLANDHGEKYTIMSSAAYHSLSESQIKRLKKHGGIIHSPLTIIEKLGGGSARCMMAELFLPKKKI